MELKEIAGNPRAYSLNITGEEIETHETISLRFQYFSTATEFKKKFENAKYFVKKKLEE